MLQGKHHMDSIEVTEMGDFVYDDSAMRAAGLSHGDGVFYVEEGFEHWSTCYDGMAGE